MATWTNQTKTPNYQTSPFLLLIGSGFFLNVGDGYQLQCGGAGVGASIWSNQTKNSASWTNQTKN